MTGAGSAIPLATPRLAHALIPLGRCAVWVTDEDSFVQLVEELTLARLVDVKVNVNVDVDVVGRGDMDRWFFMDYTYRCTMRNEDGRGEALLLLVRSCVTDH